MKISRQSFTRRAVYTAVLGLFILGIALSSPRDFAKASVARDTSTVKTFLSVSSTSWSHTVSGSDRLLVVGVSYYNFNGSRTVSNVTYGGVALTKLASVRQVNITTDMWFLTAPAVGTNSIIISIAGGTSTGVAGATSWIGVDQTSPFGTPSSLGGNSNNPTLTVASAQGEVVQDILAFDREVSSPPTASIGANQTSLWNANTGYAGGASSQEPGAQNVTMSWNLSSTTNWALIAVPIKPLGSLPDTSPPIRSNASPTGTLPAGTTSTTISLTTDENALCQYSTTAGTDFTAMTDPFSTSDGMNHSAIINGLTDGNVYAFFVRCQDVAGNTNPDDFAITFSVATPDTTPPIISGVQVTSASASAATIIWTTDEPTDAQIEYGTSTAYGSQTVLNSSLTTNHSEIINGLTSNTTYHYRVKSSDAAGNSTISNDFTFTTSDISQLPNIVVIMTDNQDRRSVSEAMPKTLQHLGQNGTEFTKAFVSYPLCCPSRASFLTGQLAHNHKVLDNTSPKGGYGKLNHTNTLPVWLSNSGYHTAAIGKYLNQYGSIDTNTADNIPACREIPPGWTEWYGAVNNDAGKFYNFILNENGQLFSYGSASVAGCTVTAKTAVYQTDLYTQKAVDYINRRSTATDGKPFFLYVSYGAVHAPVAATRHQGLFSERPLPKSPSFNEADVSDKPSVIRSMSLLSSTQISSLTKEYQRRLETLLAVDEGLENIINTLNSTGQLSNTVIIFTSDQGQLLGEHRVSEGLGWVYDESTQVPLYIRGPNIPTGQNGALTSNIDLTATILELAQTNAGLTQDGKSLMPVIRDPNTAWRTAIYLHAEFANRYYNGVRTQQHLYNEVGTESELYDLNLDPYNLTSKHNDPAYLQTKQSLQQTLNQFKTCSGSTCWK